MTSEIDDVSRMLGALSAGLTHLVGKIDGMAASNTADHARVRQNVERLFERSEEMRALLAANGEQARDVSRRLDGHMRSTSHALEAIRADVKALRADTDALKVEGVRRLSWVAGAVSVGGLFTGAGAWLVSRIWPG